MPRYMIVYRKDPQFVSHHVNSLCKTCAQEKRATWKRASFNLKEGMIFCEWEAPDQYSLERSLTEKGVVCEEIVEVEVQAAEECAWDIFGQFQE